MRDIAADNFRNQTEVNLFRGALLFHSFHSQRLIWGQYSRERSGYNFQHENILEQQLSRMRNYAASGHLPRARSSNPTFPGFSTRWTGILRPWRFRRNEIRSQPRCWAPNRGAARLRVQNLAAFP